MPRKKKTGGSTGATLQILTGTTDASDRDEEEQEAFEAADAIEDGQLSRAMEEVAKVSGAVVEVVKLEDDRQKWCRNYPVARFSNEQIATDFGAGTYRIRFKGPNKMYLKGGGTIDIAAPLAALGPAAAAPGGGGVQDVLAIIKAEREKQGAQWMEWAKLLAPLMAPKLLELLLGSRGPSLTELMAVISGAKDFHKLPPQQSMEQQLEQFAKVLALARDIGGEGKDSTGATWVDLVRDGINKVPELIAQVRGGIPMTGPLLPPPSPIQTLQPSGPSASVPTAPLSATAPMSNGASSAPAEPPSMDVRALPWLKATLESLLVQAQNDRDPDLYAQVTLDNLPNYIAPAWLLETLDQAQWWERLLLVEPRVANYVGWFRAYHEMLCEMLKSALPGSKPPAPAVPASEPEEFH